MKLSNDTVNQFIINTVLIDPVQKIVNGLKNNDFRDCDLKWLASKLESHVKFAAQTLGVNESMVHDDHAKQFVVINEYVKKYYIDKFEILLNYFNSF